MSTNGVNGCHRPELQWKLGLINSSGKYLTAESFGFKINVSGTTLKKKQTFVLEQDLKEEIVYLRSHMGRYMSADKYGNVTCEAEEKDESEKFSVEYDKAGSGRWAFKNVAHGNYLSGTEDNFKCFAKNVTESELWVVQLSIHPQVNLKNVNRKRYAHLKDEELQVTEVIPWGQEALIILHFDNGKYALKTYDNRFLTREGGLSAELTDDSRFTLEIRSGATSGLAFKDCTGTYLTAVGSTATMKGRNKTVSKDELFLLEDSCPQVILTSLANNRKVSIRQGVDVSANQDEEDTDREIFQMELVQAPKEEEPGKWAFRTVDNTYWNQENLGGIQATAKDRENKNALFEVEWNGDGTIALKAPNGKYIQSRQTGQLVGISDSAASEKEKFYLRIINRPLLLLKNENGFVGLKAPGKTEVQCSRTMYEVIYVEASNDGHYFLKGANNKYWRLNEDASIVSDASTPEPFLLLPQGSSILTIKGPNGSFIKGEQNGIFRCIGQEIEPNMLWEY
ncbi:fascin [Elysia marginata]|uniref:Fascin n=1 Tax=Elysia marginata TaxID=1093978 RepID=A0AAV4EX09_9GAST|nr:fascin [Elysia marginata]